MSDLILIVGMLAVTYSVRLLPFAYAHRVHFPQWLREALSYVPIAALTAIIAPIILYPRGSLELSLSNAHLVASVVAMLVALRTKSPLKTVFLGLLTFFLLRFIQTGWFA